MKNILRFEFLVDRENNQIIVNREFMASTKLVWKAWTTAEILDKWWGPNPWRTVTKTLDFKEGGYWLYAMIGPEGETHWSRANYLKIELEKYFRAKDGFCNENGEFNPEFPQNLWETNFLERESITLVNVILTFDNLKDLEVTVSMGFEQGFTIGLNQLETVLSKLKNT